MHCGPGESPSLPLPTWCCFLQLQRDRTCVPLPPQLGSAPRSLPGPGDAYLGEPNQGLLHWSGDGPVPRGTASAARTAAGSGSAACPPARRWPCPVAQDPCQGCMSLLLRCRGRLPQCPLMLLLGHQCRTGQSLITAAREVLGVLRGCCFPARNFLCCYQPLLCQPGVLGGGTGIFGSLLHLSLRLCSWGGALGVLPRRAMAAPTLPDSPRFVAALDRATWLRLLQAVHGTNTGSAPQHGGDRTLLPASPPVPRQIAATGGASGCSALSSPLLLRVTPGAAGPSQHPAPSCLTQGNPQILRDLRLLVWAEHSHWEGNPSPGVAVVPCPCTPVQLRRESPAASCTIASHFTPFSAGPLPRPVCVCGCSGGVAQTWG